MATERLLQGTIDMEITISSQVSNKLCNLAVTLIPDPLH